MVEDVATETSLSSITPLASTSHNDSIASLLNIWDTGWSNKSVDVTPLRIEHYKKYIKLVPLHFFYQILYPIRKL